MRMTMVVFNRLLGALESLRASTDVFLTHDCVVARVEGRQKRRLSRKTVEYDDEYSTRGDAAAWNWNHAIAFTRERPEWTPPKSYGRTTEWHEVRVPRTLLSGLAQDFLRYHGVIPWDQYSPHRIVTVWVAMPTVVAWDKDGRPVFHEEPQPEPEADRPVVPPLDPHFHDAIERARQAGACQVALDELAKMSGLEEFSRHPQAPEWALWYARNVMQDRVRQLEPIIATDPYWACCYARDVVRGRWPEAEPVIAQDPEAAYRYAVDVIEGRWPQGEAAIAKSPEWACLYAERVVGGPGPERAE